MNRSTLFNAVELAKKFVRAGSLAHEELVTNSERVYHMGTKISGACRRASLELTRALAEMRKPG